MANEVAQMSSFADVARDRVRTVLFESMPDDMVDKLIKAEFDRLFVAQPKRNSWDAEPISEFQALVQKELKDVFYRRVRERVLAFVEDEMVSKIDTMEITQEACKALAPTVLEGVAATFARAAVNGLRDQLRNGMNL